MGGARVAPGAAVFLEEYRPKKLLCLLGAADLVLVAAFTVWGLAVVKEEEPKRSDDLLVFEILVPILATMLLGMTFSLRHYHVRVDADGNVDLGYTNRMFQRRFSMAEVESFSKTNVAWAEWGGCGVRLQTCKRVGYVTESGPGIRAKFVNGAVLVFNCKDQDAFLRATASKQIA